MVKVYAGTEDEFYMDGYLKSNLDTAKRVIKKDWDMVFVVDGYEGTGKSVLAQQLGKYCDAGLSIDNIVFTPESFQKAVLNAKRYSAIIYDEAYRGLSSRGAMTVVNRTIVKMLTEIRQRNLFLFIVIPSLFELDKYVALWRSRALIHIYSAKGFERGFFAFYNVDKKKSLYMNGKKFYSYSKPSPNFTGKFTNHYTVPEEEYKNKKYSVTVAQVEEQTRHLSVLKVAKEIKTGIASNLLQSNLGMTQKDIAKVMGITSRSVYNYLKNSGIQSIPREFSY